MVEVKVYGKRIIKKPYVQQVGIRGSGIKEYTIKYNRINEPMFLKRMQLMGIPHTNDFLNIDNKKYRIDYVLYNEKGSTEIHINKIIIEEASAKDQHEAEIVLLSIKIKSLNNKIAEIQNLREKHTIHYRNQEAAKTALEKEKKQIENSLWVRIGRKLRFIR